jgi:spermidine/putrescine transport system permease protein
VASGQKLGGPTRNRLFWAALAAPGIIWLAVLFIVPFYAMLAIAGGGLDIFGNPIAQWDPLHWSSANLTAAWRDVAGTSAFVGPIIGRTLVYVALASALSLLIAYPAAYFVARFAGRRKGLFLILLIAPFWISYMMRMLAWIDLLQTNGYVNKALSFLHLIGQPVDWLGGMGVTVVLGLVYGYIPYLILVLYAGLDRIDPALIEAGRDLGLGRVRTFVRVTLPMSRQPILTGMLITMLPMLGDYFTNQLLSGATGTAMFGNVIDDQLTSAGGVLEGQGAIFSLLFLIVLTAPMIFYVVATNRSSRAAT